MPGTRLLVIAGLLIACLLLASCGSEAPPPLPARVAYEELARKAQGVDADVPNGWQHLVDAHAALNALEAPVLARNPDVHAPYYDLVAHDQPVSAEDEPYVRVATEVLALVPGSEVEKQLQSLADARFLFREPQWPMDLETGGKARKLARLCAGWARLAAEQGNWPEFERATLATLSVGWAMQCNMSLSDVLNGQAIEALATEDLHTFCEAVPSGSLAEIAKWLEEHPSVTDFNWDFDVQLAIDEMVQLSRAGDPDSKKVARHAQQIGKLRQLVEPIATLDRPSRQVHPNWAEIAGQIPDMESPHLMRPVDPTIVSFAMRLLPYDLQTLRRLAIRTHLAIERYRRANGRYPESLESLVPAFLPAVETERLSGKPLVYAVSADGSSFTLYAVGIDAQDNGGNFHPSSYHNALKEGAGQGYDFPIWPLPKQP